MKKILCILTVFLIMGQLSEIKNQKIRYGDYIQQISIIHIINGSKDYYTLCTDCDAYINVTDNGETIISDKNMTKLDIGLFGYYASSNDFLINIPYHATIKTVSSSSGVGYAPTDFIITENTNSTPIYDNGGVTGGLLNGLGDILTYVYDNSFGIVINNISLALENNFLGIKSILDVIGRFINLILYFITPIINVFTWIFKTLFYIIDLIVNHPTEYIFFVIVTNIMFILGIFIVPILFIETGIIFYAIVNNEGKEMTIYNFGGKILEAHYNILKVLSIIFSRLVTLITRVLDLIPTT